MQALRRPECAVGVRLEAEGGMDRAWKDWAGR